MASQDGVDKLKYVVLTLQDKINVQQYPVHLVVCGCKLFLWKGACVAQAADFLEKTLILRL
jgi:hypothetical protein